MFKPTSPLAFFQFWSTFWLNLIKIGPLGPMWNHFGQCSSQLHFGQYSTFGKLFGWIGPKYHLIWTLWPTWSHFEQCSNRLHFWQLFTCWVFTCYHYNMDTRLFYILGVLHQIQQYPEAKKVPEKTGVVGGKGVRCLWLLYRGIHLCSTAGQSSDKKYQLLIAFTKIWVGWCRIICLWRISWDGVRLCGSKWNEENANPGRYICARRLRGRVL